MQEKPKEVAVSFREPRLDPEDKLYVKAYLSSLSHVKAHQQLRPENKSHYAKNPFAKKEAVQYHIKKGLIQKTEALGIGRDDILNLLYQEATRLGTGSSPTARVQALQLIGKELGMFEEKREKEEVSFTIINYDQNPKQVEKIEKIEEKPEETSLPEGIEIVEDYEL